MHIDDLSYPKYWSRSKHSYDDYVDYSADIRHIANDTFSPNGMKYADDLGFDHATFCMVSIEMEPHTQLPFGTAGEDYIKRGGGAKPYLYKCVLERVAFGFGMTNEEIADMFGTSKGTIHKYRKRFDIVAPDRTNTWTANSSWRNMSKTIREVDGGCVSCGKPNNEIEAEHGSDPPVHHVIPKKIFDSQEDSDKYENLVTLCHECHGKYETMSPRDLFIKSMD